MSFQKNPLNGDLLALKNESAIARSIRNIVFTVPGEKFFDETFGSRITASLFENIDDISSIKIADEIRESINRYESRVNLISVNVYPDPDQNTFDAVILYDIIGADVPQQELQFVLQPTR